MSFWSIDEDKQTSPTLRSLLRLRPLAAQFIRTRVGSGSATSFWWDHWTPLGPLIRVLGQTGPRDLMIPLSARVCDACNDTGWLLRGARSDAALELQTHLTTIHLPMRNSPPDLVYWYINNESLEAFSASRVWDAIRHREPPHQWTASVWFNGRVPRHAFNFWIAYHDRLPTKSRLAAWAINISTACILCNSAMEDRDHLFLRCPTSEVIWACVLRRLGAHHHSFHTWTAMMDWLSLNDSRTITLLKRLASQATIYNIWTERNRRIHDNVITPPAMIFKTIDRSIRDVILGKRNNSNFRKAMELWLSYE
ncbi:PREDICTED: uncharacterized protein LOC106308597 [Brassica oleracea var. oleracea]|nr:PREDICTED: uncharacterized protein LOC106308597 [Brassica oleracea var. oleracea]